MKKTDSNLVALIINIIILIILSFLTLIHSLSLNIYEYLLLLLFTYSVILSFKEKSINIYQFFLTTLFLFMFSRIFLSIIGIYDYRQLDLFSSHYLNVDESIQLIQVFIIFLASTNIAWCINILFFRFAKNKEKVNFTPFRKIFFYILLLFYILSTIKIFISISLISNYGYLYIFTGGLDDYDFPFILYGVENFTRFFFIMHIYINRKNLSLKHILPYIIISLIGVFIGQRGPAFVTMIILFYLYTRIKGIKKIKISYVILLAILAIIFAEFIASYRYNSHFSLSYDVFFNFIYSQGISMNIIAYLTKFQDMLIHNDNTYFLHYLKIFFSTGEGGQTIDRLANNYLGDHLTYFLSSNIYLSGRGTGTTIIGELFDLAEANLVFFGIYTIFFGTISFYISKNLFKNVLFFYVGYNYLFRFIYSPRDSIGKSLNSIRNDFILLIPLLIIIYIYNSRKAGTD